MTVAFAEDVRENGGAVVVSTGAVLRTNALPIARLGVLGMLPSFLGIGESFRFDRADAIRGPVLSELPSLDAVSPLTSTSRTCPSHHLTARRF